MKSASAVEWELGESGGNSLDTLFGKSEGKQEKPEKSGGGKWKLGGHQAQQQLEQTKRWFSAFGIERPPCTPKDNITMGGACPLGQANIVEPGVVHLLGRLGTWVELDFVPGPHFWNPTNTWPSTYLEDRHKVVWSSNREVSLHKMLHGDYSGRQEWLDYKAWALLCFIFNQQYCQYYNTDSEILCSAHQHHDKCIRVAIYSNASRNLKHGACRQRYASTIVLCKTNLHGFWTTQTLKQGY